MRNPRFSKKTLDVWLAEYAVSHQNPINKKIHWVCVPVIFASIVGMGISISTWITLVVMALVALFYLDLSFSLFLSMGMFMLICLSACIFLPVSFKFWASLFVLAWIGQFVGHKLEGKKPSFFEDLQFLLIGPAWVAHTLMGKNPKPVTA